MLLANDKQPVLQVYTCVSSYCFSPVAEGATQENGAHKSKIKYFAFYTTGLI